MLTGSFLGRPVDRWAQETLGLVLLLFLYAAHVSLYLGQVNDDAFITYRYSRSLAEGVGPYFNPGEHVEGYTNFLLMLVLAPIIAVGGDGVADPAAKAIGIVSGGLALVVSFLLARRLTQALLPDTRFAGLAGFVAGGIVATSPGYALQSTSGLETLLFAFLVVSGVWLAVVGDGQGRWRGAGLAFAAATLTRPEGAAVFAASWCGRAARALALRVTRDARTASAGNPLVVDGLIVTIAAVGQLGFRYLHYDQEWLPNTYFAKSGGFALGEAWAYVRDGSFAVSWNGVGLIVAAVGIFRSKAAVLESLPVATVALAGLSFPFLTGTDWMEGWRLVVPYLPVAAVLVGVGFARLADVFDRSTIVPAMLALVLVSVLWRLQAPERDYFHYYSTVRAHGYELGHTRLAEWLCGAVTTRGDTIALVDIGIIGYRCKDQRILDISGLTDRFIAKTPGRFLLKRFDPAYVLDQKPEVIVLTLFDKLPDTYRPPVLRPGFGIEEALLQNVEFQRWYVDTSPGAGTGSWETLVARDFGAVRVFQSAQPAQHYLLAVFRRRVTPTG